MDIVHDAPHTGGMGWYRQRAFEVQDRDALYAFIRANSFGMLVTAGDGAPQITHIPFFLDTDSGPNGTLVAHVARANPHWRAFDGQTAATAVFTGPHDYISPSWYADQRTNVPTWNYTAAHVTGIPIIVEDEAAVDAALVQLVDQYEHNLDPPWTLDQVDPARRAALQKGIVAFEMPIDTIEGTFKLSQNKSAVDRSGVLSALDAMQGDTATTLAAAMRETNGETQG